MKRQPLYASEIIPPHSQMTRLLLRKDDINYCDRNCKRIECVANNYDCCFPIDHSCFPCEGIVDNPEHWKRMICWGDVWHNTSHSSIRNHSNVCQ